MVVRVVKTRVETDPVSKGPDTSKGVRKSASRPEASTSVIATKSSAVCRIILKYISFDRRVVLQASVHLLTVQLGLPETWLLVRMQACAVLERIQRGLVVHIPDLIELISRMYSLTVGVTALVLRVTMRMTTDTNGETSESLLIRVPRDKMARVGGIQLLPLELALDALAIRSVTN